MEVDTQTESTPEAQLQSALADYVMRRQLALSLRVAAVFVLLLFGLPLVNLNLPEAANRLIFGFPASWLFLGLLFYPIVVLLSIYFVRNSDAIEADCARHGFEANSTLADSREKSEEMP